MQHFYYIMQSTRWLALVTTTFLLCCITTCSTTWPPQLLRTTRRQQSWAMFPAFFKHWLSHWYLKMTQECRTFKNVVSGPFDWLLLVLAMRQRSAPIYKNRWQYRWVVRRLGMEQKLSNIHCLVHKTMNMCKSYLVKTYLKIFGASSCRCTRIVNAFAIAERALPDS